MVRSMSNRTYSQARRAAGQSKRTSMAGRGNWRRVALEVLAAAVLMAGVPACGPTRPDGPADTFFLDFSLPPEAQVHGAIVFVVDGLNAEIFNRMLEAGELPATKKYFVDRGLYAPRALSSTPTVTLANLTSLVTGLFPGHHNITGINWFDRNTLIWRDYGTIAQKNKLDNDYSAPNIYEQFPDEMTWSLFFQPHRGTTKFVENAVKGGAVYFMSWYEMLDRMTLSRFKKVAEVSRTVGRFPAITYVYLLAPDFKAYESGTSSLRYRNSLLHTDRQMGRVLADLERAGLLDKLYIALVSDHGHRDVTHHMPLERFLESRVGLDLERGHWWERRPFEGRLKDYNDENAVPYGSGDRYYAMCLRAPLWDGGMQGWAPWLVRPTAYDLHHYPALGGRRLTKEGKPILVDVPDTVVKLEATDAVAYRCGNNCVRVLRKNGEVEFAQPEGRDGHISYRVISGTDPLGYQDHLPDGKGEPVRLSSRQWLEATADTQFPDLPAQILAYFRSRRSGDIAVFAADGWDFNRTRRSGHGGLSPGDLQVPMAIAGPGVPHRRVEIARTVDLVPTILTLMGKQPPAQLDGQTLLPAAAASRPQSPPEPPAAQPQASH